MVKGVVPKSRVKSSLVCPWHSAPVRGLQRGCGPSAARGCGLSSRSCWSTDAGFLSVTEAAPPHWGHGGPSWRFPAGPSLLGSRPAQPPLCSGGSLVTLSQPPGSQRKASCGVSWAPGWRDHLASTSTSLAWKAPKCSRSKESGNQPVLVPAPKHPLSRQPRPAAQGPWATALLNLPAQRQAPPVLWASQGRGTHLTALCLCHQTLPYPIMVMGWEAVTPACDRTSGLSFRTISGAISWGNVQRGGHALIALPLMFGPPILMP